MARFIAAIVLLAVFVCQTTATRSRDSGNLLDVISGLTGWNLRDRAQKYSLPRFSRIPHGTICKFNSTLLGIDYDVACDLPEFFECVVGRPQHQGHRPAQGAHGLQGLWPFGNFPFGRRQARRSFLHPRPSARGQRSDPDKRRLVIERLERHRRSIFGQNSQLFNNFFAGLHRPFRSLHAEVGYCRLRTCTEDHECGPNFSCVDGHCDISNDVRVYAAACNVTSEEDGALVKERQCLGECGPHSQEITYNNERMTAHFCRPRWHFNHQQVLQNVNELVEDTVDLVDSMWAEFYEDFRNSGWAFGGGSDDDGGHDIDWWPFGDEDDIWASLFGGRNPFTRPGNPNSGGFSDDDGRPWGSEEEDEDSAIDGNDSSPDETPTTPDTLPEWEESDTDESELPFSGERIVKIPEN